MQDIQTSIELGVDLMKDIVAAGYSFLKEQERNSDSIEAATRRYVGGLIERYNNIKVLGMREPVPLKSLYVRANILEKISARTGLRPEDLETYFDRDKRTFGKITEPVDGEAIANRLQKFIVLGKPGAGKTTYLRFMTLMMLDPNSSIEYRRFPVFVTLHDWAQKAVPLINYITEQFNICGFEETEFFVNQILEQGKCFILFDGLDEVSREINQDNVIRQIRDFTDKYSDNQFVISCRIAAYNHWFERFTDVEIADFKDEQIKVFIHSWFHENPQAASDCWGRLKENPQLHELASVPLLLTLICLAYNSEKSGFSQKHSLIYRNAIKVLLEQWDENRPGGRVKRDEIYKNLSRQNKEALFARIAWGTFTENQYFIDEDHLARMIQVFIKNLPEYQDERALPDGQQILKQIEAHHGIFVERAKGVYSFAHLTFQEYFTAKYIVDNVTGDMFENWVKEHLHKRKWEEIFLLLGETFDSVDCLLLLMLKGNSFYLENKPLNELLQGANSVVLSPAVVVKSILQAYAIREILRGPKTTILDLLNKMIDNPDKYDFEDKDNIGHQIDFVVNSVERLAHSLVSYLKNEINDEDGNYIDETKIQEIIGNYVWDIDSLWVFESFFETNRLIVDILQSTTSASKPIREKILNEMLMPRKEE